jgi:hypothetical protein
MSGVVATMVAFAVLDRACFNREDSKVGLPSLSGFLFFSFISWYGFVIIISIFIFDIGIFSRKNKYIVKLSKYMVMPFKYIANVIRRIFNLDG